ncbi:acetyltransferase, GNAT family [Rhodovulum sp. P5]|uniref:GNAT family N-acetyltransferase n=1 Tax=Rhodovulum sp. P5 TaxID=1564506 RepID=UPI0009C1B600|nr:GNAT family N-acetyltransferase [Rhodovulum sp. P5]ARE40578.1 acetyltransferase, GNAT family [Rhodovulum sp. P5]
MTVIRAARPQYAPAMAFLLNRVIAEGGSTAIEHPVTQDDMLTWMQDAPDRSCWHVALSQAGDLAEFQWAEPHPGLPRDAADIASFVCADHRQRGTGTELFQLTQAACRAHGYRWINAAIRSDNAGGLRFYARLGFTTWKTDPDARLCNGQVTGKTYKRFDL